MLLAVLLPLAVQVRIFSRADFRHARRRLLRRTGRHAGGDHRSARHHDLNWARVRSRQEPPLVWLIATALFNVLVVPALPLPALGLSSSR